ncbi:MAG: hypothetical protein Q8M66_08990, partial [Actinomycetota bacterium]|nr:hypothetical protein [Actinomycetota bacterium]
MYAGVFAARSGAISHSQSSYVQAVISVPTGGAWLHFRYLLDSEDYWDYATLSVNGATKWQGRSDATWESVRVWLQPGSTTLRWTYVKDSYGSEGRDMFALDEVRVTQTAWSAPVAVTPGSTEVMFTVPDIETRSGAVRVRASTGLVTGAWEEVFGVVYTADATPPGVPTALTATPGSDGDISLSWTDPADADWALTRIVRSLTSLPMSPNDGVAVYEGRDGSAHDAPLSHGATAYYAAFARDGVGNWSEAAVVSADVVDETPPPPVGLLQAAREGGNVRLTWMVPAVVDAVGVRVLRTTGAPATGPDDGTAAVVFDGMGTQALDVGVAAAPVEETFYYRAWVRDATPNWSEYRDTSIHIDTLPPTGTFV